MRHCIQLSLDRVQTEGSSAAQAWWCHQSTVRRLDGWPTDLHRAQLRHTQHLLHAQAQQQQQDVRLWAVWLHPAAAAPSRAAGAVTYRSGAPSTAEAGSSWAAAVSTPCWLGDAGLWPAPASLQPAAALLVRAVAVRGQGLPGCAQQQGRQQGQAELGYGQQQHHSAGHELQGIAPQVPPHGLAQQLSQKQPRHAPEASQMHQHQQQICAHVHLMHGAKPALSCCAYMLQVRVLSCCRLR